MGDAPDGALDEGAVDISLVVILKAVNLAGAQATGELQLMGSGIDNGQHATAGTAIDVAVTLEDYAGGVLVAEAQVHLPQELILVTLSLIHI